MFGMRSEKQRVKENHPITIRMNQLYKVRKADLKVMVERMYKVFDSSDLSKGSLVSYILESEFNNRELKEWREL